ncbi:chorismate--pyruvate lyase family protein [Microbulbifer rhizosphaerae]|uniref:Chorismate-pyruvate lyase n=1 Tax=Microbulbifer rhizosphaerae TaxID=1562603 RepID=A0A7W4W9R8_9GAMM|nr:chorismate pyruvate-lyase family protein [Microbulbifer rhizosphaerae]MBB3060290.1 chorismate-pyruvate lyase [Microbulbifer rhizosphaerae]
MIILSDNAFRGRSDRAGNESSLSAFQRILLGSDGTMTNLLEGILGEDLCVNKIFEEVNRASFDIPELELCSGQRLWRRTVTLQGKASGINCLYADSLIALDNLDEKFSETLLNTEAPIGKIWDLFRVETYKSLMEWGEDIAGDSARYFDISEDETLLYRTYRVFSQGNPVMRITEKFPSNWFVDSEFSPRMISGDGLSMVN